MSLITDIAGAFDPNAELLDAPFSVIAPIEVSSTGTITYPLLQSDLPTLSPLRIEPQNTPQVPDDEGRYRVRLVSAVGLQTAKSAADINQVIFYTTPTFRESGTVEYTTNNPIHTPSGIQVYKMTPARTFSITAKFVSRNSADALRNMKQLQTLRSWRYPYFGQSSTDKKNNNNHPGTLGEPITFNGDTSVLPSDGIELLGAPPDLLYLYAYSSSRNDDRSNIVGGVNINKVPVVITSLDISYNDNVDYIPVKLDPNSNTEPMPIIMEVSVNLVESHSPSDLMRFSLSDYRSGKLRGY